VQPGLSVPAPGSPLLAKARRRQNPWSIRSWFLRSNAVGHAVVALGLTCFMKTGAAIVTAALVGAVTLYRVSRADRPVRRPRWLTLCLDEPVFAHFGASLVALPVWLVAGLGLVVARALGSEPSVLIGGYELLDWNGLAAASYLASLGLSSWAVWGRRRWIRQGVRELLLERLPLAFDGYRIVHLSDLHIGNFDTRARGLRWSALACKNQPDAIVVTGDLVTSGSIFYEDVADVIGALRAKDGVFVSLGNHDQSNPTELVEALERRGATVLQNRCVAVERGGQRLVFAGLDDAYTGRDDLDATLARCGGDATILLSHYPRFFPAAAARHVSLVLSGHTHGGQVGVPFLAHRFSVSALIEQYIHGVYRLGETLLYVSAGLGTTGAPIRLGSSPEIPTFVLRSRSALARTSQA
jgi:predicted MPP superfamily phosphohydrolase